MDESKTPATLPTLGEKLLAFDPAKQKMDRFLASDVAKLAEKHMQDIQRLQIDEMKRLQQLMDSGIVEEALRQHQAITAQDSLRPAMSAAHVAERVLGPEHRWHKEFERMSKTAASMSLEGLGAPREVYPRINPKIWDEINRSVRSPAQIQAENVQSAIVDHIRQRQGSLKEDQQLLVYCETGFERIEVYQIILPNHQALILSGVDEDGNEATMLATLNNVKIACKIVAVAPPAKPRRIGFITPKKNSSHY
jgi:hypothetical protein